MARHSDDDAAARCGASLTSVLSSFDARVADLKASLAFRGLGADSLRTLEEAELAISALEAEVAAARGAVVSEAALLEEAVELQKRARNTAATLSSMAAHAPARLPGDDSEDAAPHTAPLALVTESELGGAPSYMRSRLDVAKVNQALHEVQKLLSSKYALLCLPPAAARALADGDKKRLMALKSLESEATRSLYYFTEDELKGVPSIKADASGKNLLAVLRHVGRLKEFKHNGMRCWMTR